MSIVVNGTTATALKDGEVGNFSLSFPSGTVTATKLSQMNSSGTTVYYYTGELTKTYSYSYDTISVNGITLTSSYKLVAGTNTGIRYNAYYAKYTGGVLTLRSYRYMQTTASASNTTQLTIPSTTVKFDYTITRGSIDTVYARVGGTGSWVLVFGQGGTTTMALFFGGNWKMNKVKADIDTFFTTFLSSLELNSQKKVVIFPPACYLDYVKSKIPSSYSGMIEIGAQFTASEEQGAFTGQISAAMAKDCGCTYAIVGQIECRNYLGITDEECNQAIQLALGNNLKVIYCVGENLEQHQAGQMETAIRAQLTNGLANISVTDYANIIINYEPVWAIGTGYTVSADNVSEACLVINSWLADNVGDSTVDEMSILMGGSVTPRNINTWLGVEHIDGVLAAGSAINPTNFATIINTGTK